MNFLELFLNRVYFFLTKKTKNQAPFWDTVLFVTLVITVTLHNIILFIFLFLESSVKFNVGLMLIMGVLVFMLVYKYAKSRESLIVQSELPIGAKKNATIIVFILFTIVLFILLANVNREKIFKEKGRSISGPQRESLERRVRKWFE